MCSLFRSFICPCLRCFTMFSPSLFRTSLTSLRLNSFTFQRLQRLSAAFKAKLRKPPLLPKVTTGNPEEVEMRIRAHLMDTESRTGLIRLSYWSLWIPRYYGWIIGMETLVHGKAGRSLLLFSASFQKSPKAY